MLHPLTTENNPRRAAQGSKNEADERHGVSRLDSRLGNQATLRMLPRFQSAIGNYGILQRLQLEAGTAGVLQRKCDSCEEEEQSTPPVRIQPKLAIGAADDPLEREADHVADKVMRMPTKESVVATGAPSKLSPGHVSSSGMAAPPIVHEVLGSAGQALDPATRNWIEPRLGYDLEQVRIHTGHEAAESARAINARAYTVGSDVVFGSGQYSPSSDSSKRLLAHELAHVIQQGRAAVDQVQRAVFNVGNLAINVDYGGLTTIPAADRAAQIGTDIATWTSAPPAPATVTAIAALTPGQQFWMLLGLRLLRDNTAAAPGLNRGQAVDRLLAYAPSTVHPIIGVTSFDGEHEVLEVTGWFEVALTASLTAPTGTARSDIQTIVNPPPTTGSASDPLDVSAFQTRLGPALRFLVTAIDPANRASVGTRSISAFQSLGDVLLAEARTFFSPLADAASGNVYGLQPPLSGSTLIFDVTATTPSLDQRIGYLSNRAEIVGRNTDSSNPIFTDTNIFADVHFDASRAADRQELLNLVTTLEADPAINAIVDRLIQNTGRKSGQGASTRIGLVTEFDSSRFTACQDHWLGIRTLCHELLHALVHPNFQASATPLGFPQVVREGFTEVLGVELFNDRVVPKANSNATFKATLEAGVTGAPCPAPASTSVGYQAAGAGANVIRNKAGEQNFRAAYFLGRRDLVGL